MYFKQITQEKRLAIPDFRYAVNRQLHGCDLDPLGLYKWHGKERGHYEMFAPGAKIGSYGSDPKSAKLSSHPLVSIL
jgi:hypothetical protein